MCTNITYVQKQRNEIEFLYVSKDTYGQENPRVKTGLVDQVKFLVELSYHSNQHASI